MKASAVLMAATLAALALVVALGSLDAGAGGPDETRSLVWANRTFTSEGEFAAWLGQRNASYSAWVERHPGKSPWEGDGGGWRAFALLAAALVAILLVVVRARDTIDDFVEDTLFGQKGRASAAGNPEFSFVDAAWTYTRLGPRGAEQQPDPVRPRTVETEPVAPEQEAADHATQSDASAADSPPRRALAAWAAALEESRASRPMVEPAATPVAPDAFGPELDEPTSAARDGPARLLEEAPHSGSGTRAPEPDAPQEPIPLTSPSPEGHDEKARTSAPAREVVCEIDFWQGYVKARFYARIHGADPQSAIAASPMFRCHSAAPEQTEQSRAAFTALVDRLIAEGWEPNGRGRAWYARRFTSRVAG